MLVAAYANNTMAIINTISKPGVFIIALLITYLAIMAKPVPNAMPSKSYINIIPATDTTLILLCAVLRTIIVSIYAKGSLLPLSSSEREAVLYFKFKCLSRSIAKTLAAYVEAITEPIRKLLNNENLHTKCAKSPTNPAVSTTPRLESRPACTATFFASFQFVPKPP